MTWGQFYGYFADAMHAQLLVTAGEDAKRSAWAGSGWNPLHWLRSWYRGSRELLASPEFKALCRKFLQTDPMGRLPRYLLQRGPRLEKRLRRLMGSETVFIYRREPEPARSCLLQQQDRPSSVFG